MADNGPVPAPITAFRGEYRFLSNFAPATVWLDGVDYPSVEHAYVAAKTTDAALRAQVRALKSAGAAKRFGADLELRPNWAEIRLSVMENLVRQKFSDPEFKRLLDQTGDAELIEGNDWGDTFWGVCGGVGANRLGRILMQIRAENRAEG